MGFSVNNFLYVFIPVIIGAVIATFFTIYGMKGFRLKKMPPGMPPGWLFSVAWIIIYAITIVSFYFVFNQMKIDGDNNPSTLYLSAAYTLIVLNFLWCIVFFGSKGANIPSRVGIVIIIAMMAVLVYLIYSGWNYVRWASGLLFIYIAWLFVALYLNCAFVIVNSRDVSKIEDSVNIVM